MQKEKQAYVYAALVIMLWATVASAFKLTLRYIDPIQTVLFSAITSTAILFIILAAQRKLNLVMKMSRKEWLSSLGLGLLNPFLYYIILFKAYSLLRAQEAQPLNQTWIILLPLLSILILHQRIRARSIVALLVGFVGVLIISTGGDIAGMRFTNITGVILALGSAVIWSVFWIFNVKDKRDDVLKLFLNFALALPFIIAITISFSSVQVSWGYGIIGAVYIGIFEMGATFVLWLYALKYAKTTVHVSMLIYIVPFISLVVIHFTVGEEILKSTIVGLLYIVAGILIQQFGEREKEGKAKKSKERDSHDRARNKPK